MARRSVTYVVEELNLRLQQAGRPYMTLTWIEFYNLSGRERLKQPFLDEVKEMASGHFQLIVAYGHNAVLVCHDRNFANVNSQDGIA